MHYTLCRYIWYWGLQVYYVFNIRIEFQKALETLSNTWLFGMKYPEVQGKGVCANEAAGVPNCPARSKLFIL